ncbi:MAG: hypothetical protein OXL38_06325 [Gammaproteobacteria bacterium]|nr:hypothetical protein [Gammaproteobacteria bacterium]
MTWLGKLLPSATPRRQDHVSIWSVTVRDARTFFCIAGALWVVAFAFIVHKSVADSPTQALGARSIGDCMLAVLADFGDAGIAIGILSMMLAPLANATGAVLMSLYQAMVNRLVIPVIEAHKAEGREEGRKQGRTEVMEEWRAWNRRRLAAEREGLEFDESPPGEGLNVPN